MFLTRNLSKQNVRAKTKKKRKREEKSTIFNCGEGLCFERESKVLTSNFSGQGCFCSSLPPPLRFAWCNEWVHKKWAPYGGFTFSNEKTMKQHGDLGSRRRESGTKMHSSAKLITNPCRLWYPFNFSFKSRHWRVWTEFILVFSLTGKYVAF